MAKKTKNPRVERTRNHNTWTEAEFFGRIRNALRKTFAGWKPLKAAANLARRPSQNAQRPRLKWEYQCAKCKLWFAEEDIEVDHIKPAGGLNKLSDVPEFIYRLTAEELTAYQVLCESCHQEKSNEENYERREKRRESTDY